MNTEVLTELRKTKFKSTNYRRIASNYKSCLSMSFGKTGLASRTWDSVKNTEYPVLYELLIRFAKSLDPNFKYTSITVNKNFQSHPHYDNNNGESMIIALGNYQGGRLVVEDDCIDIYEKVHYFDGSKFLHWTEEFFGERYSIIYFTRKIYLG